MAYRPSTKRVDPGYPLSSRHFQIGDRRVHDGSHAISYWKERLPNGEQILYRRMNSDRGTDVQRLRALIVAGLV
jgi:hypothetical protein